METCLPVIEKRVERIKRFLAYFKKYDITDEAKNNVLRLIAEGMILIDEFNDIPDLPNLYVERIENFMVGCEEAIYAIGLEVDSEYCEVTETLEDFKDERHLLMKLLRKR